MKEKTQSFLHLDETWDRHFKQQKRIERMLKWLIIFSYNNQPTYCGNMKEKLPDVSNIIEGKPRNRSKKDE